MSSRIIRNLLRLILLCAAGYVIASAIYGSVDAYAGNKHFLWKVSSDSNTVYILGSLHLLSNDQFPLAKEYLDAFDRSGVIVFEVDPGTLEKPETVQMMLSKATLKGGKTLDKVLSEDTYKKTRQKLKELGADISLFNKSQPWFVAISLGALKLRSLGVNGDEGVDEYFYRKAIKSGKKVLGLETAEFQEDLLAKAGDANQEKFLLQTITDLDVMEKEFNDLVGAWDEGDTKKFEGLVLKSYKEYPGVYDEIIAERNKRWLPEIEKYLGRKENYLVVVGSGHLVGDEGLISLLRKKGYKVEQM
jgi:uncharacterized protein YbaP (TraB family)